MSIEKPEITTIITIGSDMSDEVRSNGQPLRASSEPEIIGVYTSDMSDAGRLGIKILPVPEKQPGY